MKKKPPLNKVIPILVLATLAAFLYPFVSRISSATAPWLHFQDGKDSFIPPLIRSGALALTTAGMLITLSLAIASALEKFTLNSRAGIWLGLLIIPVITGNVSTAFIWKLILLDRSFFFTSPSIKFLTWGAIQFWEYGTLFTYLFWLNQQTIRNDYLDYSRIIHLSRFERFRDILLPAQRNLILLLFVIGFIFCFYEDAKIQFVFRASRGTDTEMINQWLNRSYESDILISPDLAFANVAVSSCWTLLTALALVIAALILCRGLYKFLLSRQSSTTKHPSPPSFPGIRFRQALTGLLSACVLAPIIIVFFLQPPKIDSNLSDLGFSLLLTIIAALLTTAVSIGFSIAARTLLRKTLADFNFRSATGLILLFFLLLVPPIGLLASGFRWMQMIGYASQYNVYLAWILGHCILSFPLLTGFAIATHFRVRNTFMEYLDAHPVGTAKKAIDLFLRVFKGDYILLFLMAVSMIWNESIINGILSDTIPSFVTELNKTITGKSADYANGMKYLLISLLLAASCYGIWTLMIIRSLKSKPTV